MMCTTNQEIDEKRTAVAVVGAGASGLLAAFSAATSGADVTLFEKNRFLGKKLRITGKGRCNVTNDCAVQDFLSNVPTNPKFLYKALNNFSVEDTISFFEESGVPLKVERGNRVFPVSDKAHDIVSALERRCREAGVAIVNENVSRLIIENERIAGLVSNGKKRKFDAVIVCTGGMSYPLTGSTGDGYRFAESAGHKVTEIRPSLVPIVEDGSVSASMQGLSLKNVALTIIANADKRAVYKDFGEMMFTHFGLTGPMILSASAHISDISHGKYTALIDLKPALDEKKLDLRLLSDFAKYNNRDLINALSDLLPQKMIEPFVDMCGVDGRKKVNSVTREERAAIVSLMKAFPIKLEGFRPIDEAIVTKGGVDVRTVDPSTMESKLIRGLYFAGEVLDLDAYTGGFNLQIAFSTGFTAGQSAAWQ